ncbi:polymorphic toxin-type HINT domain-containing protein [Promicromonospora umidemergens]|uniref:polymorphic toxin-type HINT domain-containing protein n=1 Tax=Promicromonospora umidemergens TaxID=629679 RepID=UPI003CD0B2AA
MAGDKVWAHNLVTGRDELQLVVETFVRTTTELFHLTINGERVSTTAEHPFMVHDRGWLDTAFLQVGDLLVTPEGTTTPIEVRGPKNFGQLIPMILTPQYSPRARLLRLRSVYGNRAWSGAFWCCSVVRRSG